MRGMDVDPARRFPDCASSAPAVMEGGRKLDPPPAATASRPTPPPSNTTVILTLPADDADSSPEKLVCTVARASHPGLYVLSPARSTAST